MILAAIVVAAVVIGSLVWLTSRDGDQGQAPDPQEIIQNIPDAEVLWFSQTPEAQQEICSGLASNPDEYYALMKQTWLEEAGIESALFGALMTTIIDDCGL